MRYLFLCLVLFSYAYSDVNFEDLNKEHWAYSSINSLVDKGILSADRFKFDGTSPVTRYDFAYTLAKTIDYIDLTKASKEDLNILQSLMLEFSQELNKIGFDASTFNNRLNTTDETIEILRARVNENEEVINDLKKRIEALENKN